MANRKELFDSVKRTVVGRIAELLAGAERRLAPARELADEMHCSYGTMRLVLDELEREGFIRRQQGSGTYLTGRASELSAAFQVKKLLFFRPPHFGSWENGYNEWLALNLEREAERHNWKVTTVQVCSHDDFLAGVNALLPMHDAVTYAPVGEPFTLDHIAGLRTLRDKPFALFNDFQGSAIYSVTIDNHRGGAMVASLLLANNHRKIAVLYGEPHVNACVARFNAFSDILEMHGIRPVVIDAQVDRDSNRYDCSYRAMSRALREGLDVTAVFAVSDYAAWGTLDALKDAGRSVPGDVSLIGFDGLPFLDKLDPPLWSIRQPMPEIMEQMFAIFEKRVPAEPCQIMLPPAYKPGRSIRKLPALPVQNQLQVLGCSESGV